MHWETGCVEPIMKLTASWERRNLIVAGGKSDGVTDGRMGGAMAEWIGLSTYFNVSEYGKKTCHIVSVLHSVALGTELHCNYRKISTRCHNMSWGRAYSAPRSTNMLTGSNL